MRPQGRAKVSAANPRALGTCDRCSFIYNLDQLAWQFFWAGPRIQNKRILVCRDCMDQLQEQQRVIVIPADPVPVKNPRPENYRDADDGSIGVAGTGYDPAHAANSHQLQLTNFGTMANPDAAFDGNAAKPLMLCARSNPGQFGYTNWVAKNWDVGPTGKSLTNLDAQTHNVQTIKLYAPTNQPFFGALPTPWQFQGSPNGIVWTTLASGTSNGISPIVVTSLTGGYYQYHRVAFYGDAINPIGLAQLEISVTDWPSPEL